MASKQAVPSQVSGFAGSPLTANVPSAWAATGNGGRANPESADVDLDPPRRRGGDRGARPRPPPRDLAAERPGSQIAQLEPRRGDGQAGVRHQAARGPRRPSSTLPLPSTRSQPLLVDHSVARKAVPTISELAEERVQSAMIYAASTSAVKEVAPARRTAPRTRADADAREIRPLEVEPALRPAQDADASKEAAGRSGTLTVPRSAQRGRQRAWR